MDIRKKFEILRKEIENCQDIEKLKHYFLNQIVADIKRSINDADNIFLMGATPLAKMIYKRKNDFFESKDVTIIDTYEAAKEKLGGESLCILCSRPNVERHIEWIREMTNEGIIIRQYQSILALYPELSITPYAYQIDKIEKQIEHILDNWEVYKEILNALNDEISKDIFIRMVLYRLTYDVELHNNIKTNYAHYFDVDIFRINEDEIFVDCGGYNGDTLREFKKVTDNKFQKYYLFEPDENLIKKAMEEGNRDDRIVYINKGVWDENTELLFQTETSGGNGTLVMENQSDNIISIPVVTIDSIVSESSFIKMDVEGSEKEALCGAEKIIKKNRPKLAVCVYHKYEDYVELFNKINSMCDYKYYLRAQHNNIDMEIYYICIPNENKKI